MVVLGFGTATPATAAPTARAGAVAVPRPASQAPAPAPTPANLPVPQAGYHHLGATTASPWTAVSGRMTVANPGVRPGTFDFVAARFMARSADGTAWLEAGWAENGWLRDGKQRIYSYDTVRRKWAFHNEYAISPGDRVWIHLESAPGGSHWRAWLFWGNSWRLLADARLPVGAAATIEEYVEVYVDPAAGGVIGLPRSGFDNVRLRDGRGVTRFWRESDVPTGAGQGFASYCLNWVTRFDTWTAETCGASGAHG
jgi:hypothetical protein